ncbi:MAG: hypothetical protein Q8R50_14375 [Sediminibacterium sp.]|nr:hypothetical protein [Sediminibacterium sp.]
MVRFSIVKYRNRFAEFTAWGMPGKIWWDKETKNWYVEVWKKKNYLDTVAGEIIEYLLFPSTKCLPAGY